VISTVAGYSGGDEDGPTYRTLGDHTEAVLVVYDPTRVSYAELLTVFWSAHDPFSKSSRQQYCNVVFVVDEAQQAAVDEAVRALEQRAGRAVRTDVEPAGRFFAAEDYHQKYALRRHAGLYRELCACTPRRAANCAWVIATFSRALTIPNDGGNASGARAGLH